MRTNRIVLATIAITLTLTGCAVGPTTPEDAFLDEFASAVESGGYAAPTPADRDRQEALLNVGNGWCEASEAMGGGELAHNMFVGGLASVQDWDREAGEALIIAADAHLCDAD